MTSEREMDWGPELADPREVLRGLFAVYGVENVVAMVEEVRREFTRADVDEAGALDLLPVEGI